MDREEMIIDPPVGIGSSSADVLTWIDELEKMPWCDTVGYELRRARRLLEAAIDREDG